jgi:hypothetical protein
MTLLKQKINGIRFPRIKKYAEGLLGTLNNRVKIIS